MKGLFNYSLLILAYSGAAAIPSRVDSFLFKEHIPLNKKTFRDKAKFETTRQAALDQYAPAAVALFGNMITPASILGGAIIPISFTSGLDFYGDKDESKFAKRESSNKTQKQCLSITRIFTSNEHWFSIELY